MPVDKYQGDWEQAKDQLDVMSEPMGIFEDKKLLPIFGYELHFKYHDLGSKLVLINNDKGTVYIRELYANKPQSKNKKLFT